MLQLLYYGSEIWISVKIACQKKRSQDALFFQGSGDRFPAASEFVTGKNEGDIFFCLISPDDGSVGNLERLVCSLGGCAAAKK
jgi:hypothetical protein